MGNAYFTFLLVIVVLWWEQFGLGAPNLQSFVIRVLSQYCSATSCERSGAHLNMFTQIREIDWNINDLVFVHYNLKLRER